MKKLKLNLQSLNAEVLTRSQLKRILGGDGSGGGSGNDCPPNTYSCICTDTYGNIGPGLSAYGANIGEAAVNAANYCNSIGWSGASCSVNWGC